MLSLAKAMRYLPYRVEFEIAALKPGFATTYFEHKERQTQTSTRIVQSVRKTSYKQVGIK